MGYTIPAKNYRTRAIHTTFKLQAGRPVALRKNVTSAVTLVLPLSLRVCGSLRLPVTPFVRSIPAGPLTLLRSVRLHRWRHRRTVPGLLRLHATRSAYLKVVR